MIGLNLNYLVLLNLQLSLKMLQVISPIYKSLLQMWIYYVIIDFIQIFLMYIFLSLYSTPVAIKSFFTIDSTPFSILIEHSCKLNKKNKIKFLIQ